MAGHHHHDVAVGDHPDIGRYVEEIEAANPAALLGPVRVARLLDLDRRRIYEMVATGEFAAVRHGRRGIRIFRQSVIDWLRRGGSGGG